MSEICRRFGCRNDMVEEFNKLTQEKDVEDLTKLHRRRMLKII